MPRNSNSPSTSRGNSGKNSNASSRANSVSGSPTRGSQLGKASAGSKKKKIPPISIEEVFNQISTVVASNLNPPPGRLVLTPRSAEVCLKYGVNPEVLKIRDVDSFWESGIDPAVQRMRHEAYVQRRHDIMKQCRLERKRMINAEIEASSKLPSADSGLTPEMIIQQQKEQSSTLLQMEMQRLEKLQKRQEKELEQMISYEINRTKIQQEMELRLQEAKKKDELRKKQQEKRMKLMAEERRLKELQKAAMEEAEEEVRRKVAQDMHERDVKIAREKEEKIAEERRKAQEDELEKKRKHEEHRQELQRYFMEEQQALRQRLDKMQEAEKKKQDAMLQRQREQALTLAQKRAAVEQRIEHNMEMAQMIEEKRKNDFIKKQEHFENLRLQQQAKLEQERELHAQESALQEQRRRMILLEQRKEEEKKAQQMLGKFEEEEEHLEEVMKARRKELDLLKEKKDLRTQMKLENVDRVSRVGEYKRMNVLKKIEDADSRIKTIIGQRKSLVDERRRTAANARAQKEQLLNVIEELKTNASKANKIIAKAMTTDAPLTSLILGERSSSAGKKKRSKSKTTASLLGLNRSQSANATEFTGGPGSEEGGPGMFSTSVDAAQPYVSPYVK